LKPAIAIHENYDPYKPRLNVRKMVATLLDSVDPDYLQGLGSIVLSSQTQLPRKERRKKFLSRGHKLPAAKVAGFYRQSWKGQPAFIELYVDKILAPIPSGLRRLPLLSFFAIGKVLFHELGHHIHKTTRPEFKEREDVADEWSRKLLKVAVRRQYRYAIPFLRPAVRILGPPIKRLVALGNRMYEKNQLKRSRSKESRD